MRERTLKAIYHFDVIEEGTQYGTKAYDGPESKVRQGTDCLRMMVTKTKRCQARGLIFFLSFLFIRMRSTFYEF